MRTRLSSLPKSFAAALLAAAALPALPLAAADAAPVPPAAPPAPAAPAKPVAPPIPADGLLLRYKYKPDLTLKLTGTIKITQTYKQSDQDKKIDRNAQVDVTGDMAFLNVTADGAQAVAESRVNSTTAGETTFTKSIQRIDDRGRVLSDQTDLPPPTPDKDDPNAAGPAAPAPIAGGTGGGGGGGGGAGGAGGGRHRRPPADGAPVATPAATPDAPAGGAAGTGAPADAPAKPPIAAKADDAAALQASRLVLPVGKVKAGDKWTVESQHVQAGAPGAPVMKDTLTIAVKELKPAGDHNVAVLTFQLTSAPVELLASLKPTHTEVKGESEFNVEVGVIEKSTLTTDTTAQANTDGVISDLSIHAEAVYTVTVEGGAKPTGGNTGGGPNGGGPRGPGGGGGGGGAGH